MARPRKEKTVCPQTNKQKRDLYLKWKRLQHNNRVTDGLPTNKKDMAVWLGVDYETLLMWDQHGTTVHEGPVTPEEALEHLRRQARSGNATAASRLAEISGLLNQGKQEEELDPNIIIRAGREIWEELRGRIPGSCQGNCPLLSFTPSFSSEPYVAGEPEHEEGGEMEAVDLLT
jgi:hypothetical protein